MTVGEWEHARLLITKLHEALKRERLRAHVQIVEAPGGEPKLRVAAQAEADIAAINKVVARVFGELGVSSTYIGPSPN